FHRALLKLPRLDQTALRGDRNRELAARLQRVEMFFAKQPTASCDDLLLEPARRDQPALRPHAVGETGRCGQRVRVRLPERTPALLEQLLLSVTPLGYGLAHR